MNIITDANIVFSAILNVDEKDIVYVAFAKQFNGILWTGDKHLARGLLDKNFREVITTDSLFALRENLK